MSSVVVIAFGCFIIYSIYNVKDNSWALCRIHLNRVIAYQEVCRHLLVHAWQLVQACPINFLLKAIKDEVIHCVLILLPR